MESTRREHAKRCRILLKELTFNSKQRQLLMVNHEKELLKTIPSIQQFLRIVLRNPSEELQEFLESTITMIIEENDCTRKK